MTESWKHYHEITGIQVGGANRIAKVQPTVAALPERHARKMTTCYCNALADKISISSVQQNFAFHQIQLV